MSQIPPPDVLATHQRVLDLIPKVIAECEGLDLARDLNLHYGDIATVLKRALDNNKENNINFGLYRKCEEEGLLDALHKAQRFKATGHWNGCAEEPIAEDDFYACCVQSQHCSQEQPVPLQSPPPYRSPVQASYHQPPPPTYHSHVQASYYHKPPPPTHHIHVQAPPMKNKKPSEPAAAPRTRKPRRDKGSTGRYFKAVHVHVQLEESWGFDVRMAMGCVNLRDIISGVGRGSKRTVNRDSVALKQTYGQWLQDNSLQYKPVAGVVPPCTMVTVEVVQDLMGKIHSAAPNSSWAVIADTWSKLGDTVLQQLRQALA